MRKGNEHEAAHLARLEADGLRVLRLKTYDDEDFDADEARRATEEAVRSAEADVIYQAYLTDGTWRGFADFLVRLPDGTYEPVDTKLARSAKPLHAIQLCFYAEQLERIQGRLPEHVHVELGSGERATLRTAEFIAFFRRSRERLLAAIAGEGQTDTWPWPVYHCTICDFRHLCRDQRVEEDHPILVAGLSRLHAERLAAAGIPTLTALAETAPTTKIPRIRPETFERIRSQASLQLHFTSTGERRVELLPDEPDRGFRTLPPPSEGDVWLDLEGHPFYEPARGLEYLFGWCYRDGRRASPLRGRLGPRPRRREGCLRALRRLGRGAPPRPPRPARLPLRRLRAHRDAAPHGRALDARARDRRLAAAGAARRPLPRRQAVAAGRRHELLDQGDREAVRVRAHGRGCGRRRVGRPLRAVARGPGRLAARGHPRVQRGGLPLDGRAPRVAPRAAAGRAPVAGAAGAAREDGGGRGAGRDADRAARGDCSRPGRRAARAGSSRTSSTTTSARRSRSGGSGSTTSSSTRTS